MAVDYKAKTDGKVTVVGRKEFVDQRLAATDADDARGAYTGEVDATLGGARRHCVRKGRAAYMVTHRDTAVVRQDKFANV